jgi:transposase
VPRRRPKPLPTIWKVPDDLWREDGWGACMDHDYIPHIAPIRDERPPRKKRHKPKRWVVERTLAWLSKCRAILIGWDKRACNYLGLLKLACALLWFRRYHRPAGSR